MALASSVVCFGQTTSQHQEASIYSERHGLGPHTTSSCILDQASRSESNDSRPSYVPRWVGPRVPEPAIPPPQDNSPARRTLRPGPAGFHASLAEKNRSGFGQCSPNFRCHPFPPLRASLSFPCKRVHCRCHHRHPLPSSLRLPLPLRPLHNPSLPCCPVPLG